MLLVVQRVRSLRGEDGVNRFAYLAGEHNWNDPRKVLDSEPTTLLVQSTSVEPGGNHVRSYLDVVFPDNYTREQATWILSTIPRVDEIEALPYTSSLGDAAWRFNAVLELHQFRQGELEQLAEEAYALAMSWFEQANAPGSGALSETERSSLELEAGRRNTGAAIDFLRALAARGRIPAMVEAVDAFASKLEANGAGVRGFLRDRVPGILMNNYLNTLGPRRYNRFIEWTLQNPGWADELRLAAGKSGQSMEAKLRQMLTQAGAA